MSKFCFWTFIVKNMFGHLALLQMTVQVVFRNHLNILVRTFTKNTLAIWLIEKLASNIASQYPNRNSLGF